MKDKFVVLYLRLSKAEENTAESHSIHTQRQIIHQFLDAHPQLCQFPRFEAVDDGFSGSHQRRPMLQKVLSMAENGEIQAICVKDSSRFFRNHIKAGEYIDLKFPLWGVQFLSVTDEFDSFQENGSTTEQSMRHIFYAQYPKFLSHASTSAKIQRMKQGHFIGGFPPFGYDFDPEKPQHFVPDPVSSQIVKEIFQYASEMNSTSGIASILNTNLVDTPGFYAKKKNPHQPMKLGKNRWTGNMVYQILTRYTYTGTMVGHRRKRITVGEPQVRKNTPILVENTHTPIISEDLYQLVQEMFRTPKRNPPHPREYPLKSVVHCGACGRSMRRGQRKTVSSVFYCVNQDCPNKGLRFLEDSLNDLVFKSITQFLSMCDFQPPLEEVNKHPISYEKQKILLYYKYIQNQEETQQFQEKQCELQKKINLQIQNNNKVSQKNNLSTLTPELVQHFITSVTLHNEHEISFKFSCDDFFRFNICPDST